MDNQPTTPPQQETFQPTPEKNLTWLKTLSIGFSLVSFGIAIGIGGYILGTKKNQPIPQNQQAISPTPLPAETSVKEGDPTANWKTYNDPINLFQFKIPVEWIDINTGSELFSISNYESSIDDRKKLDNDKKIEILISNFDQTLNQIETSYKESDWETETIERINFNSLAALKINFKKHPAPGPNFPHAQSLILIIPTGQKYSVSLYGRQNDSLLFEQILSTFKFTDQSPTPTCRPRPACLDSNPRCMIAETADMCPASTKK